MTVLKVVFPISNTSTSGGGGEFLPDMYRYYNQMRDPYHE